MQFIIACDDSPIFYIGWHCIHVRLHSRKSCDVTIMPRRDSRTSRSLATTCLVIRDVYFRLPHSISSLNYACLITQHLYDRPQIYHRRIASSQEHNIVAHIVGRSSLSPQIMRREMQREISRGLPSNLIPCFMSCVRVDCEMQFSAECVLALCRTPWNYSA